MSDDESPLEGTQTRARKRLLPSVSEVVRLLSNENPDADPGLVYRTAREVCARELGRVKDGFEAAPVEVLVQRAHRLMKAPEGTGSPAPAPPFAEMPAAAPEDPSRAPRLVPPPSVEEPFGETVGALDLRWTEPRDPVEELPREETASLPGPEEGSLARLDEDAAAESVVSILPLAPAAEAPVRAVPGEEAGPREVEVAVPVPETPGRRTEPRRSMAWAYLVLVPLAAAAVGWGLWRSLIRPAPARETREAFVPPKHRVGTSVESTPKPSATPPVEPAPGRAPASPAPPLPTAVPATPAPAPAPVPASVAAATPVRPGRASFTSADWAGKEPVFVVHFSSYKGRAAAEKDALRIGKAVEEPVRVVAVDLGEKGKWYRVVAGEFSSAPDAQAWRKVLEEKKTPDLGFVYRMTGP